jgi:Ni,Fe-hydrogenase III small subunit/formate hydrogenlyase subunit 6/NADH:ubiquinone oxidoreductase subunit I
MLTVLRAALRVGRVTTTYPAEPSAPPLAFRGAPTIDPGRCDCSAACVDICPADAITLTERPDRGAEWKLDLASCVFCGLCADACPTGAISMSGAYELATRSREDLLTIVHHGNTSSTSAAESKPGSAASVSAVGEMRAVSELEPTEQGALGRALAARVAGLLRRSLHIRHLDAGSDNSTDWELNTLLNPVYDVQRLGMDVVASPRHADLLFVTGPVTRNLGAALQRAYEAMPRPRIVVAAGAEACGGGIVQGSYAHAGGVDHVLPVDVYIPGDPPRPEAIIYGLLLATDRIDQRRSQIQLHTAAPKIADRD